MRTTLYAPPENLTSYVECFWTLQIGQEDIGSNLRSFANGVSGIIFQHCEGRSGLGPATAHNHPFGNQDFPTLFLYGKRTTPSYTFTRSCVALTGVVFRPQALNTLLNIQPADITNAPLTLGEVSNANVGEALLNARNLRERFAILAQFLRLRLDHARAEDLLVTASLRLIHRRIGSIRVQHLLKCLNVSERQFERRFIRAIGVSPHQYIRIVRFQEAVRLLKTGQFDRLSDVAYALSYADQSHFIKDIREFSGYSPTRLAAIVRASVDYPCGLIPARISNDRELLQARAASCLSLPADVVRTDPAHCGHASAAPS